MSQNIWAQIRVIDRDRILPFEWNLDPGAVTDIALTEIESIHHPFLVSPHGSDYLLLGDSEYFEALAQAGLGHFPVQVASREHLRVHSGPVGLIDFSPEEFRQLAARYPDQIILGEPSASSSGRAGFLPIRADFANDVIISAILRHSSRIGCPRSLDYIFRAIARNGRFVSIAGPGSSGEALTRARDVSGILTLPRFGLNDLATAVTSERLFPPGIIQVISDMRILNVDFPMSVLAADGLPSDKELFFKDLVRLRAQALKLSYYEGRVYLLNR